jgi:hypothetical protein
MAASACADHFQAKQCRRALRGTLVDGLWSNGMILASRFECLGFMVTCSRSPARDMAEEVLGSHRLGGSVREVSCCQLTLLTAMPHDTFSLPRYPCSLTAQSGPSAQSAQVESPESSVLLATMANNVAPGVLMGGRQEGGFWPGFVPVPDCPPPPEEDDEDDDDADEPLAAPVLRRPAARVHGKRPAASPSSQLRRPARADSFLESDVPAESPVIPQKIPQKRKACSDAVSPEPGKRTYGCGRCLMRTGGCDICRKPGFKPRGPRKEKALPAAPEP